MRIISIDGYRMAIRREDIDCESDNKFIVPGKMQSEILKLITDDEKEITIIVGQRHVTFNVDTYSIVSRIIEGNFLDYRTTVPKSEETVIRINTRQLINAVDRMALITNDRVQSPVRFAITQNEIKLSCRTAMGRASDEIPVSAIGKDVVIGFNNRYFLDALKNSECDEVMLVLNGSLSPMIVKPVQGESFLFLVVPMRLNDEI